MEKYSAEWWVQHDLESIKQMKVGESSYTSFGGEYHLVEENGKKLVEVFGPDDSYSKFEIEGP